MSTMDDQGDLEPRNRKPRLCAVLLYSLKGGDEVWVEKALRSIFRRTDQEIELAIKQVQKTGRVDCGTFPRDLAETRSDALKLSASKQRLTVHIRISPVEIHP